jgi:DNA polymerase-3 subunit delta'
VAHAAGRVPATLRSRCRALALRALAEPDVAAAATAAAGNAASEAQVAAAAAAAEGSVARAVAFLDQDALQLRQDTLELLDRLPALNPASVHAIGDQLAGSDVQPLTAFVDTVNAWLSRRLDQERGGIARLHRLAEAWGRINQAARETEIYNLERKPFVFVVFGLLAEATRG